MPALAWLKTRLHVRSGDRAAPLYFMLPVLFNHGNIF